MTIGSEGVQEIATAVTVCNVAVIYSHLSCRRISTIANSPTPENREIPIWEE